MGNGVPVTPPSVPTPAAKTVPALQTTQLPFQRRDAGSDAGDIHYSCFIDEKYNRVLLRHGMDDTAMQPRLCRDL